MATGPRSDLSAEVNVIVFHREKALRNPWIAPALLFLLALGVRLYRIGAESIWLDEATSLFLARQSVFDVVAWTARDIHPPLYYLLLHFWRVLGESEMALRSLSALAGAASVAVLYGLGRRLFDGRTGAVAALLLALAPLHVWYSQQARMYTWLGLWMVLAAYLLVLALEEQKIGYWLALAVVNALALYTHYYTVFGLLVQGLFALYLSWRTGRWRGLSWAAGMMAFSVLLFAPWLPTMYFQVSTGGGGWVARAGTPGLRAFLDTLIGFTVGNVRGAYPVWMRWAAYLLFAALCLWAVAGGVRAAMQGNRREEKGLTFALIYLVVPLAVAWLISQAKPLYADRYLLVFLPGYLLLAARGLATLTPKAVRWGALALVVGLLLFGVWQMAVLPQNTDWRGAAAYVSERFEPGDVAVFYPGWNEKPFAYYWEGTLPSWTWFKVPLPADEVASSVNPGIAGYRRAWLIWSIGHYGDPQGLLKRYLDHRFRLLDVQRFRGSIGVALYELTTR